MKTGDLVQAEWPEAFVEQHGRRPRVLHVGNVGNNAYLNARFLREAGVECHVLAYDYYDRLATPEWEGHVRPPWFVQGPLATSAAYLEALLDGDAAAQRRLALRLRVSRAVPPRLRFFVRRVRISAAGAKSKIGREGGGPAEVEPSGATAEADDLAAYRPALPLWKRLFARYDVVQAYATDPIWPFAAGKRPYVAYEHGTLREFTSDRDALSRLTARAYRESDHTFVTNGDCLAHAERIGIPSFSPMIHPVDVDQHRRGTNPATVRKALQADVLLFCPMRHDWEVKGTDVHIRALPRIVSAARGRVVLALCDWGRDVARSRRLVDRLGCKDNVAWLPLMPRRELIATMRSADVVLEQMMLPHFDATVPQALAAGVPVVMSYRPESMEWMVREPAPVLSAFDASDVEAAVATALSPTWRAEFGERARTWIQREHDPRRLVAEHCRVYREVLERSPVFRA